MSQTCTICLAECMNPYTYLCPRNFSTTARQFCRVYLCATCVANKDFLKNGCPNCRAKKGKGKFIPPGHTNEVLAARAPTEPVTVASSVEVPDFSENAQILTTKRRPIQTNFYQPDGHKSAKRFARCFLCSGNTSVRFCDASVSGFSCQNCREHDWPCLFKDKVLNDPPTTIGKKKP